MRILGWVRSAGIYWRSPTREGASMIAEDSSGSTSPRQDAVTLVLRLSRADSPPRGSITEGKSGSAVSFHGWIEMMMMINQLRSKPTQLDTSH